MTSTKKIIDAFTNLPVSRQVKYQMRKKMMAKCPNCGKTPVKNFILCHSCRNRRREYYKNHKGTIAQQARTAMDNQFAMVTRK